MDGRRIQGSGSAADLPSSHGGGVLPGNQIGLSGSAAARTANDGRAASVACLSSVLPPRKEDDARCPFLGSAATVVVEDEEAETSAIARASCVALESVGAVWWAVGGARQFKGSRGARAGAGPAYPRGDSGRGRLVPRGAGESARLALARRIALTWRALRCDLRGGHGMGRCHVGNASAHICFRQSTL